MKKILILFLTTFFFVSCGSDELVVDNIWFGCKSYNKSIAAWFFLLPKGEYVDFVEGDGINIINGSYGIDIDGNKVELKYKYSIYYNPEKEKGYADYTGEIPFGEYFVVCSPTNYNSYMGINIEIKKGKITIIVPDFTGISEGEKGLLPWK